MMHLNGNPLYVLQGDVMERLAELEDESVQCVVTSPPYWGLRDYSVEGQLGLEATPDEYVGKMVAVFREVRRVLRRDGTLWLNLGDSYAGGKQGNDSFGDSTSTLNNGGRNTKTGEKMPSKQRKPPDGLKSKDLVGIPWRVAFALQADGWWLRSDIIWAKPNPMPESVTDRPTKSHEYLFLLTKSASYFYDAEAIKEGVTGNAHPPGTKFIDDPGPKSVSRFSEFGTKPNSFNGYLPSNRNKRSVWTIATQPYPEAHFATYPPDLIKPCIMAGTSAKGCCAKCGAPWERMVERISYERNHTDPKKLGTLEHHQSRGSGGNEGMIQSGTKWNEFKAQNPDVTLGWQPTCECDADIQPCTVLDPFAGSGTTGMVALELGRKAVLIELNPSYCELIETRCNTTLGLALA